MTSKIKVDNINKVSDDSNIIKKCGTTTTIGSGASNPIVVDGSAITLGRCGGTVALASGATQSGFGRTGTVDWQTGSIKTAGTFTAVSGEGYFVDTSSGGVTANLPAGVAGAIVSFADYTRTFQTNALTVSPNGSNKIGGVNADASIKTEGQSVTFVFVDATEGWINVQDSTSAVQGRVVTPFIIATGGTITTSGDDKIHTFTGPGTFCVTNEGTGTNQVVSHVVVAGGGGGGHDDGGGGGAGGFRENESPVTPYTASPLSGGTAVTISTIGGIPITVGAGGAAGIPGCGPAGSGSNSIFSTITSAGGGFGARSEPSSGGGGNGGSGGGADAQRSGGSGNTPPVSPPQGKDGGAGTPGGNAGGGGGGAGNCGSNGSGSAPTSAGGPGGAGVTSEITASPITRAGGGGGGAFGSRGNGGSGGGGAGAVYPSTPAVAGSTNTGGGGGGGSTSTGPRAGATGGSGVVIIRYKFQ